MPCWVVWSGTCRVFWSVDSTILVTKGLRASQHFLFVEYICYDFINHFLNSQSRHKHCLQRFAGYFKLQASWNVTYCNFKTNKENICVLCFEQQCTYSTISLANEVKGGRECVYWFLLTHDKHLLDIFSIHFQFSLSLSQSPSPSPSLCMCVSGVCVHV